MTCLDCVDCGGPLTDPMRWMARGIICESCYQRGQAPTEEVMADDGSSTKVVYVPVNTSPAAVTPRVKGPRRQRTIAAWVVYIERKLAAFTLAQRRAAYAMLESVTLPREGEK